MAKKYYENGYMTWEREQQQKKDELAKQIRDIAENWQRNPEEIADYLKFSSKFYNYSVGNTMLIYQQNPNALFCGSFQKFKELGYSVKRGEKGIKIFTPVIATYFRENSESKWKRLVDAKAAEKEKVKSGEYESRRVRRWKVGNVFDISQTTCPIEDYPKIFRNFGYTSEQHGQLFNALAKYSQEALDCPVSVDHIKELTVRGFYRPFDNTITISDRLQDTEKLSVLTHELGHAILHNDEQSSTDTKTPAQIELEADAVSLMLQNHVGVEITDPRKAHLAGMFHSFERQQENSSVEPDVTLEDILDNVNEMYRTQIDTIQNYIDQALSVSEKKEDVFYSGVPTNFTPPYVHVIYSEDPALKDNSYYTIKDAQNIFEALDAAMIEKPGYNKTKFQICFADGTHYEGRQDFGDGDGGLIDHIQKFWESEYTLRTDLDPQELNERHEQAELLVKTLWDAYDNDYISTYGVVLEKYKAQGNLEKIMEAQNKILEHLGYKRNRELEFERTGTSHKIPILSFDVETESSAALEDDAAIEA